jgi:hypothetical protein
MLAVEILATSGNRQIFFRILIHIPLFVPVRGGLVREEFSAISLCPDGGKQEKK